MTRIVKLEEIKNALKNIDLIQSMELGFAAYSRGETIIPPVGELLFDDPPGDVHIKYGCIKNDDYFVIKVASGFYENQKKGLPNSQGVMLLFSQKTGELLSVLLDEGHLTNVRTAAAGAVAARYLAPRFVENIGILGAGIQGRLQLQFLKKVTNCRTVWVWGLDQAELDAYKADMQQKGFSVSVTCEPAQVAAHCNLIVTATPAKSPLLDLRDIQPGSHITAVGSDTAEKIELDPAILRQADILVADSRDQAQSRGEIFRAQQSGAIDMKTVFELGDVILRPELGRSSENQLTVADLTGLAVQDIQIAKAVYHALTQQDE